MGPKGSGIIFFAVVSLSIGAVHGFDLRPFFGLAGTSPKPPPPRPPPRRPPPPRPPPPRPPPSPPPPAYSSPQCTVLTSCPLNAITRCDFVFSGTTGPLWTVPEFPISNANGDQPLTQQPVISTNANGTLEIIANTGPGCASKCVTRPRDFPSGSAWPDCTTGNIFYGTQRLIQARKINLPQTVDDLNLPNCIILPITNAQIRKGNNVNNLNPGDNNQDFKESRRCIVFKIRKA